LNGQSPPQQEISHGRSRNQDAIDYLALGDRMRIRESGSPVNEPIPENPGKLGFPQLEIARQQGDTTSKMELNRWFPETTQSRF